MKSSKLTSVDSFSGVRRLQPPRLTRNNPPRLSTFGSRSHGTKTSVSNVPEEALPIEIFPAITHFADAISALPKELIRHFTLLKEVDAKIFVPEEELMKLVNDALNTPPPPYSRHEEVRGQNMLESAPISTQSGLNNSIMNCRGSSTYSTSDNDTVWDPANFNRRKLFNQCTQSMQSMLVSLDEKNHVISTAGEALAKQLARIDDCLPFIELEISEEARNGSKTHWAYAENRIPKSNCNSASRKEQPAANQSHTAVQTLSEDATSRSDTRKQALLDKRRGRNQQIDPDLNDQLESKQKDRKSNGNGKARKSNDPSVGTVVGMTHSSTLNSHQSKRRKVEKGPMNVAISERSTSWSYINGAGVVKGRPLSPVSTTPQPECSRKRARAAPTTSNGLTSRKRQNVAASATLSLSSASPPLSTNNSEVKKIEKKSPPPTNNGRSTTTRCRQSSIQSSSEKKSVSPSKSKSNGNKTPDLKNAAVTIDTLKRDAESSKKNFPVIDSQEVHETPSGLQSSTITTTKSGRASKPSTPAISSFPDSARSRGTRTPLEMVNSRRSHKKGAGAVSHIATNHNITTEDTEKRRNIEEDADVDADEPRYCLCNNVSYGEMVACDSKDCKREWFHLACVGLKTAPKGDATWYCEDCKEATKGKRSSNGR